MFICLYQAIQCHPRKIRLKYLLIFTFFSISITSCSTLAMMSGADRVTFSRLIDGYWDSWQDSHCGYQGDEGNFVIYRSNHPSDYSLRLKIYNASNLPSRKGESRKYKGTIEFRHYENDSKAYLRSLSSELGLIKSGSVYSRSADIEVQKTGDGYIYNVYFDGVGLALSVPWKYSHPIH